MGWGLGASSSLCHTLGPAIEYELAMHHDNMSV